MPRCFAVAEHCLLHFATGSSLRREPADPEPRKWPAAGSISFLLIHLELSVRGFRGMARLMATSLRQAGRTCAIRDRTADTRWQRHSRRRPFRDTILRIAKPWACPRWSFRRRPVAAVGAALDLLKPNHRRRAASRSSARSPGEGHASAALARWLVQLQVIGQNVGSVRGGRDPQALLAHDADT